jgi:hypothetical protein
MRVRCSSISDLRWRGRKATEQSLTGFVVGVDGTFMLETKLVGYSGGKVIHLRTDGEEEGGLIQRSLHSSSDRRWRMTMPSM